MSNPKNILPQSRRKFLSSALVGGAALMAPSIVLGAPKKTPPGGVASSLPKQTISATDRQAASGAAQLAQLQQQSPELGRIAEDALNYAKYSVMAAAAGAAGSSNDFADVARTFVASRQPKASAAYAAKAKQLLATPQSRAEFGSYAALDPDKLMSLSHAAVAKQIGLKPAADSAVTQLKTLNLAGMSRLDLLAGAPADSDATPPVGKPSHNPDPGLAYKRLEFKIVWIRCLDSSGGVFEGDDELLIGGVVTGAQGAVVKVPQTYLGEFDDGDVYTWPDGGYVFHKYDLITNKGWPTYYSATVALADQDDGGFADFLNSLWSKIGSYITSAISAAATAGLGAALGAAFGGLGAVVGAVVGALIGWLISLVHNEDDIIGTQTATLSLGGDSLSYYNWAKLTSPGGLAGIMSFSDDGFYRLQYSWRVSKT